MGDSGLPLLFFCIAGQLSVLRQGRPPSATLRESSSPWRELHPNHSPRIALLSGKWEPSQLRRYFNFAKDEKYEGNDFLLLYLTLDGHDASPDSLRNKDNDKVPYTTISYKEHIINWLKRCTEIAALNPLVRETIRQYIINLNQLLNSMEESYKNAVIETLMKGENLSAALNIIDVSNDLKARIRKDFIDKRIKDLADNYQLQMTYDDSALFLTKDKSIYFKKDDCPHFYYFISFETRRAWQGIQFNFINGQGPILSLDGLETIWDDGKGKEWPYGWAWLKNCDYWDTSDTLIDMRNGNQLINEIEENLKIVVSKQLLKKAEEAYMQRMKEMPEKAV